MASEPPPVSVVIPARDAEATLTEALSSLLTQTVGDWEAIVVDDGSSDSTAQVARRFAERDRRVRLIQGDGAGVSAARNRALRAVRHDWLLFLDADDTLVPEALERLRAPLLAEPAPDVVHGGWTRVFPNGESLPVEYGAEGEPFLMLARYCPFAIHSALTRRSLVERVGGFDPDLRCCQDWDLWQRLARAGARFVQIGELVARYRHGPHTATSEPERLLRYGLMVIERGHASDPRVPEPSPAFARGADPAGLSGARHAFAAWVAGFALGKGLDAAGLFELAGTEHAPELDALTLASSLAHGIPLGALRGVEAWPELWPRVEPRLDAVLAAQERRAGARGLGGRTRRALERLVAEQSARPLAAGSTSIAPLELSEPFRDIEPPRGTERLLLVATLEGERLGTLELPVCDGLVQATVLADAAADELFWEVLRLFFERSAYRGLRSDPGGWLAQRGLDEELSSEQIRGLEPRELHERIGWWIFLQELWGTRERPGRFYEWRPPRGRVARLARALRLLRWRKVEVSGELRRGWAPFEMLVTVGGAPLGVVPVERRGRVGPRLLRSAITTAAGAELCRLAVREALLGRPLDEPGTLRDRLALAPGARASPPAPPAGGAAVILGRHGPNAADGTALATSASRRAALPADAAEDLLAAAKAAGEQVLRTGRHEGEPARLLYAPELGWRRRGGFGRRRHGSARGESESPSTPATGVTTERLPILAYHRVAPSGGESTARYRLSPEAFEEQLDHLCSMGFRSVGLETWRRAMQTRRALPGRAVLITFDDGYRDFAEHAWPLLRKYGFRALLFIVTGEVGRWNRWGDRLGERLPLLDWDDLVRLRAQGVELGAHSASHPHLTALSPVEVVREAARSRADLTQRLGEPPTAFAYPHGDADRAVRHLVGASGFRYGLTVAGVRSRFQDRLLDLPRIEIEGGDGLPEFISKLGDD